MSHLKIAAFINIPPALLHTLSNGKKGEKIDTNFNEYRAGSTCVNDFSFSRSQKIEVLRYATVAAPPLSEARDPTTVNDWRVHRERERERERERGRKKTPLIHFLAVTPVPIPPPPSAFSRSFLSHYHPLRSPHYLPRVGESISFLSACCYDDELCRRQVREARGRAGRRRRQYTVVPTARKAACQGWQLMDGSSSVFFLSVHSFFMFMMLHPPPPPRPQLEVSWAKLNVHKPGFSYSFG